ncbi:MAG TPA: pyridoxamine 5'-phosphate oxidase, partial [Gemmataceae bacterium]|nr:pyridoxamine 5'-phosphate oxidase [Gemmataceae bacterium]
RREYMQHGLRENDCAADPMQQFRQWLDQALAAALTEATALTLATCTLDGRPSARIVLLKGIDERGFVFFTNYDSRKGKELAANPRAALVCFWADLERQIRIEGRVEKITPEESDAYHRTRPRGSQLGAWTSYQSEVIAGREVLEERLRELEARFGDGEVPRPPHWGGYRLVPEVIEFWQGRPNRLHDRIRYRRLDSGQWVMERLAP